MTSDVLTIDRALFAEIASGDERAFAKLFYRYNTKVYYFVLNILDVDALAQDVVQDVFLKLWLSRADLTEVANPGNFLFVMAKHRALDHLDQLATARKFRRQHGGDEPGASETEEQLWYRESLALVNTAVEGLPEQQKQVFRLIKLEGLSREEVATQLGISPHTVKNHLGAAVKSVQQYLLDHGRVVVVLLFLNFLNRH